MLMNRKPVQGRGIGEKCGFFRFSPVVTKGLNFYHYGLAHATGVHERNTVPYARFALKKRHGFCAKAREKNMQRHRLGTL